MNGLNIFRVVAVGLLLSWVGWLVGEQYTWKKPEIAGFHWTTNWVSGTLWTPDDHEAASVVMVGSTSAQVCIFNASGVYTTGCEHFRTTQEAFDYVGRMFKEQK